MFTLQILHASDLEGGPDAVENAANFAAIVEALEADAASGGIGSILLSAGDNAMPGPFFNAAQFIGDQIFTDTYNALFADVLDGDMLSRVGDGRGFADIAIMNIIGFDASAVGNREFDAGPDRFESIIEEALDDNTLENQFGVSLADIEHFGAQFPYLSANLDFSGDSDLGNLFTSQTLPSGAYRTPPASLLAGGGANPDKLAAATTIAVDGGFVGVLGATTQRLESLSATGGVTGTAGTEDDMQALADVLNPVIAGLIAGADATGGTADDLDKIVLVSHLQDIGLEKDLAGRLNGVDVIVAGGSGTLQADGQDTLRPGDVAAEGYPFLTTNADGDPVAIVSTAGQYSYVGRLVVEFDDDGVIVPGSIDANVSGAFATDAAGTLAVTGAATLAEAIANSESAALVQALTQALQDQVTATDGNVFGETAVFLDGRRETVRTQESNLGNLVADANLAAARSVDPEVLVSLAHGGGIHAQIGEIDGDSGALLPPGANPLTGKEAGEVSELDIQSALLSDNGLTIVDLATADLKIVLEHAVARSGPGAAPGEFLQVGGIHVSVDLNGTAQDLDGEGNVTTPGGRIVDVALTGADGRPAQLIIDDGQVAPGAPASIKIVSLDFLVNGGDGSPLGALGASIVETGIGEQAALQDFLATSFPVDGDTAFAAPELPPGQDGRIQFIGARTATVDAPIGSGELTPVLSHIFQGEFAGGDPELAAEVVAYEDGLLYVTNGNLDRIDIFDVATGQPFAQTPFIDLTALADYDGVQSVAVKDGLAAVAANNAPVNGESQPGQVAVFDAKTGALLGTHAVGVLPDMLTFTPDGGTILVANEGEFNAESAVTNDAPGSISFIDLAGGTVNTVDLTGSVGLFAAAGTRVDPALDAGLQNEPEYISVSPDGATAFVSIQESNAIAVVDIASETVTGVLNAGAVDHSLPANALDFNDRDAAIDIATAPLLGLRMPDALAAFDIGGQTFIATANEGDGRGDAPAGDEARVGDILDGAVPGLGIDPSVDTAGLERLTVSTIDGDTDDDGDIDQLHSFGGRAFTIFDADGNVVFEAGSEIERILAELGPARFLDDDGDAGQDRADNKGAEPEAIEAGTIRGETYLFIGMERDSGVFVYNVSDPANARFVDYIDGFANGMVGPEIIEFIPQAESGGLQNDAIAVAYEISGETAVFELFEDAADEEIDSFYFTTFARSGDAVGHGFWKAQREDGLSRRDVAEFFAASPEFQNNIAELSTPEAVDFVYLNATGAAADAAGNAFWSGVVEDQGFGILIEGFVNIDAFNFV